MPKDRDRYRLHLSDEDLDMLQKILETHDWMCNCKDFPECEDFRRLQKMKTRVETLRARSWAGRHGGRASQRKNRRAISADTISQYKEGYKG